MYVWSAGSGYILKSMVDLVDGIQRDPGVSATLRNHIAARCVNLSQSYTGTCSYEFSRNANHVEIYTERCMKHGIQTNDRVYAPTQSKHK